MTEYVRASVSDHLHAPDDIVALGDWQASIERSLAGKTEDIRVLQKCLIVLFLSVVFLAVVMLVLIG